MGEWNKKTSIFYFKKTYLVYQTWNLLIRL